MPIDSAAVWPFPFAVAPRSVLPFGIRCRRSEDAVHRRTPGGAVCGAPYPSDGTCLILTERPSHVSCVNCGPLTVTA